MTATTIHWLHTVIVKPTLTFMAQESGRTWLASDNAQAMLLGIAMVESRFRYTRQVAPGKNKFGPARSFWQVEPATARDVLSRRLPSYGPAIKPFLPPDIKVSDSKFEAAMRHSQSLGCMLARLKLMDARTDIPCWTRPKEQAEYWKIYYNSRFGAGDPMDYRRLYVQYVEPYARGTFAGVEV